MARPALNLCLRADPLKLDQYREEFRAIAAAKFNQARNRYDPNHLHQERIVDLLGHWVGGFAGEPGKVPVL